MGKKQFEPKILTFKDFCLFLSAQQFMLLKKWIAKKGQFETPKKTELDVKKTSILKVPVRRKVIIEIIVSQNYLSFDVLKSVVKVNVP